MFRTLVVHYGNAFLELENEYYFVKVPLENSKTSNVVQNTFEKGLGKILGRKSLKKILEKILEENP